VRAPPSRAIAPSLRAAASAVAAGLVAAAGRAPEGLLLGE